MNDVSVFANFCYQGKKKKLVIHSHTTLHDLNQLLCTRFVCLTDPDSIQLNEKNILHSPIHTNNFTIAKEILFKATNNTALFDISYAANLIIKTIMNHRTQSVTNLLNHNNGNSHHSSQSRNGHNSPSPSPLPISQSHNVRIPKAINLPLQTHESVRPKPTHTPTNAEEMKAMNAIQKMKMELMHRFPKIPHKSNKLFNYILNNKVFLPTDESIDSDSLHSIVCKVIEWWFKIGIKKMVLGNDNLSLSISDIPSDIDKMIENFSKNVIKTRDYQSQLFKAAIKQNIICFMPTGSGKTRIAIKFIEHRLKLLYLAQLERSNSGHSGNNGNETLKKRHIIFLVCTTHLAEQQKQAIKSAIPFIKIRKIIGANNPDTWNKNDWRMELNYYDVFVMMHDCLISALSHGYITMRGIDTLILDECHHVVGNRSNQSHPYTIIMDKYLQYKTMKKRNGQTTLPRIMGLTASPIKTKEAHSLKISKKAEDLQRKMDAVLMRVDCEELQNVVSDPMIVYYPYFNTINLLNIDLFDVPKVFMDKLPKYAKLLNRLGSVILECGIYGACVAMRLFDRKLRERDDQHLVSSSYGSDDDSKMKEKRQAISLFKKYVSQKLSHFDYYLHKTYSDREWQFDGDISMKLSVLIKFISDSHCSIKGEYESQTSEELFSNSDCMQSQQGIIFVKERLVAYVLQHILSTRFKSIKFGVLTGHSCRLWCMNDKQQLQCINAFKTKDINYLIATSVAEEGIDIQACNGVIMYTLPTTVKTYIQSRGRARKKRSKFVLFIDSENDEEKQRVSNFAKHEREMINSAQSKTDLSTDTATAANANANNMTDTTTVTTNVSSDRYEYKVSETQAFASTVNAVSMLQRYIDYLGFRKGEMQKVHIELECGGFKCQISFADTHKWKLKRTLFENIASNKRDAERKCVVDIIACLRENGLWDLNLVPVEILRRNKETELLQKERALFQSIPIEAVHIPSLIAQPFQSQSQYLYHIRIADDPNHFPIGLLLPKPIPTQLLQCIKFPIQIRKRNDSKVFADVNEYVQLIHNTLNSAKDSINECKESDKSESGDRYKYYTHSEVTLTAINTDSEIQMSESEFAQVKAYHKLVFTQLDCGGSKKKQKLVETDKDTEENERFYLICPLSKDLSQIDFKCIETMVSLRASFVSDNRNCALQYYSESSNLKFEMIQTRNSEAHVDTYISYGSTALFDTHSCVPIEGQIIADCVSEDTRLHRILNSNISVDTYDKCVDSAILYDEIDLNAQHTQLNKLQTQLISDKIESSHVVIVVRRYSPKVRNVLQISKDSPKSVKSNSKKSVSKSSLKSSVRFLPLSHTFPTGISTQHWYALLNVPSVLWRLENFFNIFDAHQLFSDKCNVAIEFDLLFEALCNVQAGMSGQRTYEKLECLGDKVLKFLIVTYGVFTMPDRDQGYLTQWESNIVMNFNLDRISSLIALPSFGVFNQFAFELWNPAYFCGRRVTESLYKNIKISLKLPADIIESTLGALWQSNRSINECWRFCSALSVIDTPFQMSHSFTQLITDWNTTAKFEHVYTLDIFQHKMKELCVMIPALNTQNPLVTASLIELIDKSYRHHHHSEFNEYGITYQRLEFLGDAILDIVVTQFLFDYIDNDSDNQSIEGKITSLRAKIVGNDSLGFNFQDSALDEIIIWDSQQKNFVLKYKREIDELEQCVDHCQDWWYLSENPITKVKVKPPKCLGDAFEVLLAVIFIDSNSEHLIANDEYDFSVCAQFICDFHDFAERFNNI